MVDAAAEALTLSVFFNNPGAVSNIFVGFLTLIGVVLGLFWHAKITKKNFIFQSGQNLEKREAQHEKNIEIMLKQHTFRAITECTFNRAFQDSLEKILAYSPNYRGAGKKDPNNFTVTKTDKDLRLVLNYIEGLAAALRGNDLSEELFKNTYRGTVKKLFIAFESHIFASRPNGETQRVFEHLEWLYNRWEKGDNSL